MKISNLTVKKGEKTILNKLDLNIQEGAIHVIMGPNGSGKSTFLSTIAGAEDCEVLSGKISFKGENILDKEINERALDGIHLSVQYPPVIEGLSNSVFLQEAINVRYKHAGKPPVDAYKIYKAINTFAKKYNFPESYYKNNFNVGLSGGEKKRNEILQIDLLQPDFVMLDEIDSGLDIEVMTMIGQFIKDYVKQDTPKTVVIITHYPTFAQALNPSFVHILRDGQIVKTGDASLIEDVTKNGFGGF